MKKKHFKPGIEEIIKELGPRWTIAERAAFMVVRGDGRTIANRIRARLTQGTDRG
jgi:uncharacterized protein YbjT (DUF2867 family)